LRERTLGLLLGLIIGIAAGAGAYWATTFILSSKTTPGTTNGATTTLPVEDYGFTLSPQGALTITKMYYTLNGIHALVIQGSFNTSSVVNQVSSDGRTYNVTGFTITPTVTWFIIPGWNCGYSNDNGRAETTQLVTSTATYSLSYNCIYPANGTNMTFTGLVAPTHTPCTYVGSQPASCTSLMD
jgi:hypothetical protein